MASVVHSVTVVRQVGLGSCVSFSADRLEKRGLRHKMFFQPARACIVDAQEGIHHGRACTVARCKVCKEGGEGDAVQTSASRSIWDES